MNWDEHERQAFEFELAQWNRTKIRDRMETGLTLMIAGVAGSVWLLVLLPTPAFIGVAFVPAAVVGVGLFSLRLYSDNMTYPEEP